MDRSFRVPLSAFICVFISCAARKERRATYAILSPENNIPYTLKAQHLLEIVNKKEWKKCLVRLNSRIPLLWCCVCQMTHLTYKLYYQITFCMLRVLIAVKSSLALNIIKQQHFNIIMTEVPKDITVGKLISLKQGKN